MAPGARQPRRLLRLLSDTNANVREVANRPACADMLRAIDAGEPSTPAGCAEAWLVLQAMANVPLADQAEPPLYNHDLGGDEALGRRRLDRGASWNRRGSAFDWCVLRMAHTPPALVSRANPRVPDVSLPSTGRGGEMVVYR
jgi:hypothetical protein